MSILKILATYRLSRYYKILFLVGDILFINLAILLSFLSRYGNLERTNITEVQTISLLSNVIWILLILYKNSYRILRTATIENVISKLIEQFFTHIAIIAIFIIFLDYDQVSRLRMIYFYLFSFLLLALFRIIMMKFLKYLRTKGFNYRNVIIIGANSIGERMYRILSKDLTYGYKVLGFFDDNCEGTDCKNLMLGKLNEIESYLLGKKIDEMYIALPIHKLNEINRLTTLCERKMIRIKYVPDFQQYTKNNRVNISFYGNANMPVLMLRKEPLELPINRLIKRTYDFLFCFFAFFVVIWWLFPIIIILIKIDSKGPIFFKQKRSGRDNKPFDCYKFRTMYVNDSANKIQATQNDSRITKVGAFLRKTSLDELPQFFNVLLGQMSSVGPRPHMLAHTMQYAELIDNFLVRHYAKPGVTGWAQVNGYRGETKDLSDMVGRVEHDIWYIENWNFLLDIKIMIMTFTGVFIRDKKAY